jgi:IS30 family transposase
MKKYKRLNLEEREEISRMLAQNYSINAIARYLNRHPSTISREIRLGGCSRYAYRALRAQRRSGRNATRRKAGRKILDRNEKLRQYVYHRLRKRWSPEQIAKELLADYPEDMTMRISPETIYAHLYILPRGELRKELLACLRQNHKRRHKQSRMARNERKLEDMLSIEERPEEAQDRTIPGHWESDLIVGKNNRSAMGTIVERTTRTTILVPLKSRDAETVAKAFAKEMLKLPQQMRISMTHDQGREMAKHKLLTEMTGVKIFFAHPRSPWERGTNENTNGLIRQFFPKGTDFNKVSRREIKKVQDLLNGRPRAALNFQKPIDVFNQLIK